MLHTNFTAVEREILPIDVLHCRNRNFRLFDLFGFCDLDLDPMTFIYELNPYSLDTYRMCESEHLTSKLSKVIV